MSTRTIVVAFVALLIGAITRDALSSTARADNQPAFDRALAERIVRAQETQAEALKTIAHAQEQQARQLENVVRAIEHGK
jgi:flagellar hook-basal body complex protein FliE